MFHDVWVTNIVGLNLKLFSKIAQHFCFFFFFFWGGGGGGGGHVEACYYMM
jgi:hypothetical protein